MIPVLDIPDTGAVRADVGLRRFTDDPRLQAITDFAASLCATPVALVSLVEDDSQWFPARTGLDLTQTPREQSLCAHSMMHDGITVVPDARQDARFAAHPLVAADPGIRFYAGVSLVAADGTPLGALCVVDYVPRDDLTDFQAQGLRVLADSVMGYFGAYRSQLRTMARSEQAEAERDEQRQRFAILADTMPQMVWSTRPDGYHDYYNAKWYEFTGMPPGSTDGAAWNDMFHPDDQQRAWAKWSHSLVTGEPYDIEYRLRAASGDYRWVLGRALPMRGADGEVVRWFGTCTDIHEHKLALEQREIVSHELSHRIKNIFAVIGGLIGLSARQFPQHKLVADELRQRVIALGRAHDFVRPHSEASNPAGFAPSLKGMLIEMLAPYQSVDQGRITVAGDDPEIDDRSATPLALLFHELATNALKYGALSKFEGRVLLTITCADREVRIDWVEQGGPPAAVPTRTGFGTRLIELSIERQLGGRIVREWGDDGLKTRAIIPLSAMSRAA